MTDTEYRATRAYSNSDLSELIAHWTNGSLKAKPVDEKTARFDRTFHRMILEPGTQIDWSKHHPAEFNKLAHMRDSYRQHATHPAITHPFQDVGRVVIGHCPVTELPLKCRIDAVGHSGKVPYLVELKITSARTEESFLDTFVRFGYDRQAAFSLDMMGMAYGFLFVGIQRNPPFSIYEIDMSATAERRAMVNNARTANARLLTRALAELQEPYGWRPSSWAKVKAGHAQIVPFCVSLFCSVFSIVYCSW